MKTEKGKMYYEIGDVLYHPYINTTSKVYEIIEVKVINIDTNLGCVYLNETKYAQKRVGLEYTPHTMLFLSKEYVEDYIKDNPLK